MQLRDLSYSCNQGSFRMILLCSHIQWGICVSPVSRTEGGQTRPEMENEKARVLKDNPREVTTYLSHKFSNTRDWFPFLVTPRGWTLPIPVLQFFNAFQIKQGFEASAVVLDDSKILILNSTAYLEKVEQPTECQFSSVSSVAQSYQTLCDPMDCSTPGLSVHHQLPEFTQTHVH